MPTPSTRARKRATQEATLTPAVGARAVRRRAGTPDPAAMDAPASASQVEVDKVTASDGATEQAEELADDEGPAPAVGAVAVLQPYGQHNQFNLLQCSSPALFQGARLHL